MIHSSSSSASSNILYNPASSIISYGDGAVELLVPAGFRFHPTATQLVEEYLVKRVLGDQFPAYIIRDDIDVYSRNPDQLPLDIVKGDQERWGYFFTFTTQKYQTGSQCNRTTPDGHWKASGNETCVQVGEETIAFSRKLVFYWGRSPTGIKTHYIMQEYQLNQGLNRFKNRINPKMNNCVICKVYTQKPRSTAKPRMKKAMNTMLRGSEARIQ